MLPRPEPHPFGASARVLEGFDLGARLRRGGAYARRGQVLDVAIEPGAVTPALIRGEEEELRSS